MRKSWLGRGWAAQKRSRDAASWNGTPAQRKRKAQQKAEHQRRQAEIASQLNWLARK